MEHKKVEPEVTATVISALDNLVPRLRAYSDKDLFRQICIVYVTDDIHTCDIMDPVMEFHESFPTAEMAASKNMFIVSIMALCKAAGEVDNIRVVGIGQPVKAVDVPKDSDPKGTKALHMYFESPNSHGFYFFGLDDGILAYSPVPLPPFKYPPQFIKKAGIVKKYQDSYGWSTAELEENWFKGLGAKEGKIHDMSQALRGAT